VEWGEDYDKMASCGLRKKAIIYAICFIFGKMGTPRPVAGSQP